MKAYFGNFLLLESSKQEVQLMKVATHAQMMRAYDQRENADDKKAYDRWNELYTTYQRLYEDLKQILNSMPF